MDLNKNGVESVIFSVHATLVSISGVSLAIPQLLQEWRLLLAPPMDATSGFDTVLPFFYSFTADDVFFLLLPNNVSVYSPTKKLAATQQQQQQQQQQQW
jgi:hypothetical protein